MIKLLDTAALFIGRIMNSNAQQADTLIFQNRWTSLKCSRTPAKLKVLTNLLRFIVKREGHQYEEISTIGFKNSKLKLLSRAKIIKEEIRKIWEFLKRSPSGNSWKIERNLLNRSKMNLGKFKMLLWWTKVSSRLYFPLSQTAIKKRWKKVKSIKVNKWVIPVQRPLIPVQKMKISTR